MRTGSSLEGQGATGVSAPATVAAVGPRDPGFILPMSAKSWALDSFLCYRSFGVCEGSGLSTQPPDWAEIPEE